MLCSLMATAMVMGKCAWIPVLLLLCCLSMGSGVSGGVVGAPAPTSADCSSAILSLAGCLPFVQQGSKLRKPDKSCCDGLKKVVKEDVSCLCDAFKQSATFGVSLNTTKALALPAACGVSTPPFTKCNIAVPGVPSAAPAPSPGAPTTSSSAGQSGSVPAPSPVHSASGSVPVISPAIALLASVAIAVHSHYL